MRCIAGILNLTEPTAIDPQIKAPAMADAITHRGPDEDGFFFRLPARARQSPAIDRRLIRRRNSRFPTKMAPFPSSSTANFDYPEVKGQLQAKGHRFRAHCDTELIPHLYEDHGDAVFEQLRGQFAVALWDERKRQLLLARDRFGICPLYWTRQGDWLLFASEIKSLLASGMVPAKADPRGINHLFTFFATPGPVTCFEGINCLLPGRYLRISSPSLSASEGPFASAQARTSMVEEKVFWEIDFPDVGQEERRDFSSLQLQCGVAGD